MTRDIGRSRRIAAKIAARNKECWSNAYAACSDNPRLTYVEGYAVKVGWPLVMGHGWCVAEDGETILDPTPAWCESDDQDVAYFPVKTYTFRQLCRAICDATEDDEGNVNLPLVEEIYIGIITEELLPVYDEAHTAAVGISHTEMITKFRKEVTDA